VTNTPSKISHVDLVVSSIQRSLPFYRGLLEPIGWSGLSDVRGERGETIHYLSVEGPGDAALGLREKRSDAHALPYDRYAVGVHHLCFDVPSREVVDERAQWLRGQAARIESGPAEYEYTPGYYAVFFYDPDGIKLELLHRPTYWEWLRMRLGLTAAGPGQRCSARQALGRAVGYASPGCSCPPRAISALAVVDFPRPE
jgi:glyoxylase I family protein